MHILNSFLCWGLVFLDDIIVAELNPNGLLVLVISIIFRDFFGANLKNTKARVRT